MTARSEPLGLVAESARPRPPRARGPAHDRRRHRRGRLHGRLDRLALRRQNPALGIALLETGGLGQGASGRNGGQVLNWV